MVKQVALRGGGHAGNLENGGLFTAVITSLPAGEGRCEIEWTFHRSATGELEHVVVTSIGESSESGDWKEVASSFITSVLSSAFSDQKHVFFSRTPLFYIGENLDGEYWLPGFRFAPVLPDDEHLYHRGLERVVCVDQTVSAIDGIEARVLAEVSARKIAARLSVLMDEGLCTEQNGHRWVTPIVDGVIQPSLRANTKFLHENLSVSEMPRKGAVAPLGRYSSSLCDEWPAASGVRSLPRETRRFLRAIDNADPFISDAFDRCARLYQVGLVCGAMFPSVGLAYRVAAVEALSSADISLKSFGAFMRKYVKSVNGIDELLNYLYGSARSAHFHAGEFQLGEFSQRQRHGSLMDIDRLLSTQQHLLCFALTREAIMNWMLSITPRHDSEHSDPDSRPPPRNT